MAGQEKQPIPEGCQVIEGSQLPQVIQLSHNQKLLIQRTRPGEVPQASEPGEDCLRLIDGGGATTLTIRISAAGAIIELGGPVALNVQGDLAIAAQKLLLHGRESVALSSDTDIQIAAGENLETLAKRQAITSTRGDVRMYANDDVKIDGERIRMNC